MDNNKKRHQPTFACVGIGDLEVEVDLLDELALLGDELLELGEAEAHAVERDLVIVVVVHRLEVDVGHGGRTTCLSLPLSPSIATDLKSLSRLAATLRIVFNLFIFFAVGNSKLFALAQHNC